MRLKIPLHGSDELLARLPDIGGSVCVYGSFDVRDQNQLETIARLTLHGARVEYSFDVASCENREYESEWRKSFLDNVERLLEAGVNTISLSSPTLLHLVRENFRDVGLVGGAGLSLETVTQFRYYEDLGVREFELIPWMNRNLRLLRELHERVRAPVWLTANHLYSGGPAARGRLINVLREGDPMGAPSAIDDYYETLVLKEICEDPSILIQAPWIRPQDVGTYEAIGYTHFKLLGWSGNDAWALRQALRYLGQEAVSNVIDMLAPPFSDNRYGGLLKRFSIDNGAIPDDYVSVRFGKNCDEEASCAACGYCESIAEQAISFAVDDDSGLTDIVRDLTYRTAALLSAD